MRFTALISCHYTLIHYIIMIIITFYFKISEIKLLYDSMKRFKIKS